LGGFCRRVEECKCCVPRHLCARKNRPPLSSRKTGPTRFALFSRQFYVIFASARVFVREDPLEM
jgi:hypothetical protein